VFCPKCGSEYRAGFQECADCGVPLVESVSASQPEQPEIQFVTVFESGDPALIALAQSLLDSAEIPFMTKGEGIQDLFGWGRMPGAFSVIAGPVQFQVNEEDVEEARALLVDLHESNQDGVEVDSQPEDDA
jgi:Putative prokaryotic signal transducing protein